jgi:CRISPR/Cas system CSM-associated protein Csm3 (group 7 of RAMP superfamily)
MTTPRQRLVRGEYVLTGTLRAMTPLAIGSGEPGSYTDSECARDGQGRLMIPGSALAGVLRATHEGRQGWGSQDVASVLFVEDAILIERGGSHERLELRDGVAIDRRTGAAAHGALYNREVVAKGATFALDLRLEVTDSGPARMAKEDARRWLLEVANDLAADRGFGGRTSAGLGKVQLTEAELVWRGTGERDSLLALLSGAPSPETETLKLEPIVRPRTIRVTVPWQAQSPLLVSVAFNGMADRLPLVASDGGKMQLVIPGTSWKGVLRSRAEWIVRTVSADREAPAAILDQFTQPLGPVGRLFGVAPHRAGKQAVRGRRGALRVGETYSNDELSDWAAALKLLSARPARNDAVERVTATVAAQEAAKKRSLQLNTHVALSRWTGGADEGKLFATVAPTPAITWQPLVLEIDSVQLGSRAQAQSALMLLAYVLRDVADGWVGVGHGSTRGYGEVTAKLEDVRFDLPEGWEPGSFTLADLFEQATPPPWCDALLHSWKTEIAELGVTA